ncbi:putative ABC transporter ATP-binding protein YbhF [Caulifigura coniformis]|uniref:Putative ABC transporter ATP-binding protein YbhF n=1 Tax=Caulifigura coniformis TaxID=2527983 RepID=A0A517SKB4_9PLAN|nr:ABC transporter ATP-binding protein [Caulifigura coniformis]QDT56565.1 putative ABC transporter ATP-binding protein YbhF [Caulifigura coniformis]
MIEAIDLKKFYGQHIALRGLNLAVQPGEIFCLLGANGAGKTTTISLFLGFIAPSSGRALVNGVDVAASPDEAKRSVAYIPETVTLYPTLSGFENLEYFATLAGGAELTKADLKACLERAGLREDAIHRPAKGYSKGMRQKVAIAVAIAKNAKALFLDEPTSGLDPQASNEFSRLLEQLSSDGVAVLMATHDLFRAKESGTRIGIMRSGELVDTLIPSAIGHAELEERALRQMRGAD